MKEQDWWWRLRREFKKTDPASMIRFSDRKSQKLEKSIMDEISKTSASWAKKKGERNSPNP